MCGASKWSLLVAVVLLAHMGTGRAQDINEDNFFSLSEDGKNLVLTRTKEGQYGEWRGNIARKKKGRKRKVCLLLSVEIVPALTPGYFWQYKAPEAETTEKVNSFITNFQN